MSDSQHNATSNRNDARDSDSRDIDTELSQIVNEEQLCLMRVIEHVQDSRSKPKVRA